jgi:hypothetical protein
MLFIYVGESTEDAEYLLSGQLCVAEHVECTSMFALHPTEMWRSVEKKAKSKKSEN